MRRRRRGGGGGGRGGGGGGGGAGETAFIAHFSSIRGALATMTSHYL